MNEIIRMVDAGYLVLAYDGTGSGYSEGKSTVGLFRPALDLDAAFAYISFSDRLAQLLTYGPDNFRRNAVDSINSTDTPILLVQGDRDQMIRLDKTSLVAYQEQLPNPHAQNFILTKEGQNGCMSGLNAYRPVFPPEQGISKAQCLSAHCKHRSLLPSLLFQLVCLLSGFRNHNPCPGLDPSAIPGLTPNRRLVPPAR